MANITDINPGDTFGKWTVLYKSTNRRQRQLLYVCRCECGDEREVIKKHLIHGYSKSCGCGMRTQNGLSKLTEYGIWGSMVRRCTNINSTSWNNYGGRGITVCEEWQGKDGFVNFLRDMGQRPSLKHSLERKNNNKPYSKDNCEWVTASTQNNNKRSVNDLSWATRNRLEAEAKRRGLIK